MCEFVSSHSIFYSGRLLRISFSSNQAISGHGLKKKVLPSYQQITLLSEKNLRWNISVKLLGEFYFPQINVAEQSATRKSAYLKPTIFQNQSKKAFLKIFFVDLVTIPMTRFPFTLHHPTCALMMSPRLAMKRFRSNSQAGARTNNSENNPTHFRSWSIWLFSYDHKSASYLTALTKNVSSGPNEIGRVEAGLGLRGDFPNLGFVGDAWL